MTEHLKCKAAKLNNGDKLSTTIFYTVEQVDDEDVHVVDETGERLRISRDVVEREGYCAFQYDEEVQVTRTELVQQLQQAGDTIFAATFQKADKSSRQLVGRRVPAWFAGHLLRPHGGTGVCQWNAPSAAPNRPPHTHGVDSAQQVLQAQEVGIGINKRQNVYTGVAEHCNLNKPCTNL